MCCFHTLLIIVLNIIIKIIIEEQFSVQSRIRTPQYFPLNYTRIINSNKINYHGKFILFHHTKKQKKKNEKLSVWKR